MSLVISRNPGESFVLIDANDPESFCLVTIVETKGLRTSVRIDAPQNVHILRREILHRYAVHKDVLETVERMEAGQHGN